MMRARTGGIRAAVAVVAVLLAAGPALLPTEVAGAGSCPPADMKIARRPEGPYVGKNECGGGQDLKVSLAPGQKKTFYVKVKNKASTPQAWGLHGPASKPELTHKYLKGYTGKTDITAEVEHPPPNYEFEVGAKRTKRFRWRVKLDEDAAVLEHNVQMSVRSGNTTVLDRAGLDINEP